MKKPRLLAIEMHHLGDAVLALPFLRAASRTFEVQVFCRPGVARFLQEASPESRVTSCDGWRDVFRKIPELGEDDAVVSAWPDPRAHLAMRRSGARRRIGFRIAARNMYGIAHAWRRRRLAAGVFSSQILSLAGPLLTHPLDRASAGQSHLESWTQIAQSLDLMADVSRPWLPVPEAPAEFQEFVRDARNAGMRMAIVHGGGRLPSKRWPVAKFEELLRGWFPEHRLAAGMIRVQGEDSPAPQGAFQQTFESASPAALAGMLALADGVVCNDSFAAHLAAATGVPVVTIFGSGDPAWFAPFGNAALVVASNTCPFRPCVDRCVQPSFLCLEEVSICLVEEKLSAMFPNFPNPTTL
jgi:ADP-heptose:LPS heptosyltransferase